MNPAGFLAIFVALVVGYLGFSGSDIPFLGSSGNGPLATGPGRAAEVANPQPVSSGAISFGLFSTPPPANQRQRGDSPYRGRIRIAEVSRSSDRPESEYVRLRYGSSFSRSASSQKELPVDVTGWSIASLHTVASIPRAFNIPEVDAGERDVFLIPGGEVIVVSGAPSYARNFRENACIGYLNQAYSFTPALGSSCIDSSIDRGRLLRLGFNGACIDAIDSISDCRTPKAGSFMPSVVKASCIDYMNENFSYAGCVKNFRDDRRFLQSTWRVRLERRQKMFDSKHDIVTLRDRQGLIVDQFEY